MIYSISIFCLFVGIQAAMYWKDGGIHVADSFTTPPLSQQFHVLFKPIAEQNLNWFEKWSYWRTFKKFPKPESCLKSDNHAVFDISNFDWESIQNESQMSLCLHHVILEIRDLDKVKEWLEKTGFDTYIFSSKEVKYITVSGHWSEVKNGKSHPFSKFSFWTLNRLFVQIFPFPFALDFNLTVSKNPIYMRDSRINFISNI